jgi:hypothetical protein
MKEVRLVLIVLLGMVCLQWFWWLMLEPMPIKDWQEGELEITSATHPDVKLVKVLPWNIEGRVVQSVRISDPILPTDGGLPSAIISPVDVFLVYGILTKDRYFDRITASHMFRSALPKFRDYSHPDTKTIYQLWNSGEHSLGGRLHEHTIPKNYLIYQKLCKLKRGDKIKVKGHIVDIIDRGRIRRTSRSKNDTSCEYLFITELEILN